MTCPSACCESKVKAHQCECVNNFNHENMSNEHTPLTAEELRQQLCAKSASNQRLFYTDVKSYMLGFYNGYDHNIENLQKELISLKEAHRAIEDLKSIVHRITEYTHLPMFQHLIQDAKEVLSSLEK